MVTKLLQKYINILFLKSSTFIASITVAGKLFHILKVDGKRSADKHQGVLAIVGTFVNDLLYSSYLLRGCDGLIY